MPSGEIQIQLSLEEARAVVDAVRAAAATEARRGNAMRWHPYGHLVDEDAGRLFDLADRIQAQFSEEGVGG